MYTLDALINKFGLNNINTLTKYPSILTYHELGDRGSLQNIVLGDQRFDSDIFVTEKIDGTNARIVILNNDYIIGSREDFLFAKGDRIVNPSMGIVETLKEKVNFDLFSFGDLVVIFGEIYGGNVGSNSKEYTVSKTFGFRIFDVATYSDDVLDDVLNRPIENISSWRENGGQSFLNISGFLKFSQEFCLETVPYRSIVKSIPEDLSDVYSWLQDYHSSHAGIDNSGRAEGMVVRNQDRSLIRKIRFEDYERTKKRGLF
jgi:hypothetical protein